MTLETGSVPESQLTPFQSAWLDASRAIISDPTYSGIVDEFRQAYEFRAQFPWLGESHLEGSTKVESGLAYATRYALERYFAVSVKTPLPEQPETNISSDFQDKFGSALNEVIKQKSSLELFQEELENEEIDTASLNSDELIQHMLRALSGYSSNKETGLSQDPW